MALLVSACGDDDGSSATRDRPAATDAAGNGEVDLPDPCEFATAAEVSAAIGTEMEAAGGGSGDFDGIVTDTCAYRATTGEELFASVQVLGGFADADEVRDVFGRFGDVDDAGINGLPDSTFVTDVGGFRTIFVVDADQPYGVNVSGGPGDEDRPDQAERLALTLHERE
ncbi:MAG: hypothetical protein ACRDY6_12720 [Acidimicrobiia bacterium]